MPSSASCSPDCHSSVGSRFASGTSWGTATSSRILGATTVIRQRSPPASVIVDTFRRSQIWVLRKAEITLPCPEQMAQWRNADRLRQERTAAHARARPGDDPLQPDPELRAGRLQGWRDVPRTRLAAAY